MARGLSAGEISALAENYNIVEDLVEMYLFEGATARSFYYTTGPYPATVTTSTSGSSQTYTPRSFIANIGNVTESYDPGPLTVSFVFQRLYVNATDDFMPQYLENNFLNRRIAWHKLFRNTTTYAPDTTNGKLLVFDGVISSLVIEDSLESKTYSISAVGAFADYDRVRGRTTADIFGALQGQKIYWGSLTG
jgi:hypothetical protein